MTKKAINLSFLAILILFCGLLLTGCLPHHHNWSEWSQLSSADCTKDEILVRRCDKCKATAKKVGAKATGHEYVTTIKEPTESENGYSVHECHCGEKHTDSQTCLITFKSATDNIYIDLQDLPQLEPIILSKNSILTEIKSTEVYMPVAYRIYFDATSYSIFDITKEVSNSTVVTIMWDTIHQHNWSEWSQLSPATCTEDEVLTKTCKECNFTVQKVGTKATGHNHITTVIDPTENTNGYSIHECHCGDKYIDNETCLITFKNATESVYVDLDELPQLEPIIIAKNSLLPEVKNTEKYKPAEFRVYTDSTTFAVFDITKEITNSTVITIMWEKEISKEEKDLYDLANKIKKLEEISIAYNTEKSSSADPQIRVLQYLRQARYSDSQWNMFGGTIESDFDAYVTANQGDYDLKALQTLQEIVAPTTKEKVDFVHMIAIINVVAKGGLTNNQTNDLVGWGGDLCQLAVELKATGLTGDALQQKAYNLFNSQNSTFSSQDLLADLDALNITSKYLNQDSDKKSISEAMKDYYLSLTIQQRKESALKIAFPDFVDSTGKLNKTQAEMTSAITSRISGNFLISIWCSRNGLNLRNDSEVVTAATMAFVKYFID